MIDHRIARVKHLLLPAGRSERFLPWLFAGVLVSAALAFCPSQLEAGDWMFQRSYYSHRLPPDVPTSRPESRSAYRTAYVGAAPGFSARASRRINVLFLQSGNSSDLTIFDQFNVEFRP